MASTKKKDFTAPTDLFLTKDEGTQLPTTEGIAVPEGYVLVREPRSKRLQLLITPTIENNLKQVALVKNISLNELCNRIFEEYLRGLE